MDGIGQENAQGQLPPGMMANKELLDFFPDVQGETPCHHVVLLCCIVGGLTAFILIIFSGVLQVAYDAYDVLVQLEAVWYCFVGAGLLGFLVLHGLNWYRWPLAWKAIPGAVALYTLLIGIACHAKRYPSAPLIVLHLQYPIAVGLFRFATRKSGSVISFFRATIFSFSVAALSVICIWAAWIFAADIAWDSSGRVKLRSKLGKVFERYDLDGWDQCVRERALSDDADDKVIAYCSRMELISFLIWSCPGIQFLVLVVIAIFCGMRYWVLRRQTTPPERVLRFLLFMVCFFCTAFWIACSTAGASMNLSRVMFASIATGGCCFAVWVVFAIDLASIFLKAKDTVVYKTVMPALGSDYFAAAMFCATQFAVCSFLLLEILVRQLERLCCVDGECLLTRRGRMVAQFVSGKHWASTLEKSFNLCILFLVFFLFSRFTPVFLSWLRDALSSMNFGAVVGIFYIVGIIMFLLPPVPGVPVYMAAGTIIVARGKQEPWLDFWSGIAFASVLSLVLKLSAVVLQQKGIGEQFGKSLYVQQLVGVHTTSIRAIEKILKKDGLTMEKVAILCGGPDWPTSVLTGILRLKLLPMLIGTLPCLFLIVPCVLGGASLTEESMKSLSPIIIMLVGVTQGGVMLGALVFIAKETERSQEELSIPREEHAELIRLSKEATEKATMYKSITEWKRLTALEKCLLVSAAFLEIMICWILQFMGGACFRAFAIGNFIKDDYSKGGLRGDVTNMIRGPGYAAFGAILFGAALKGVYSCIVRGRSSRADKKASGVIGTPVGFVMDILEPTAENRQMARELRTNLKTAEQVNASAQQQFPAEAKDTIYDAQKEQLEIEVASTADSKAKYSDEWSTEDTSKSEQDQFEKVDAPLTRTIMPSMLGVRQPPANNACCGCGSFLF